VAAGALAGGALAGDAFATPPTQPLEDPRLTPTMPANPQLLGINRTEGLAAESPARAPGKRRRGGRRGIALAAIAAVLLLAVVASGAMKRGANLGRPAADTHAARSRTTPAKSPAASDVPTGTATPTTTGAKATETPVSGTTGAASRGHDLSAAATEAHTLAGQYNAAAAKIESLKATGAEAGQNAILANLLLQTASAYSKAERAATRGDEQGYANAIADAKVAKGKLDQASQAPAPASSSAPSSSGSASSGQGSSCAGDSQSDDPSDDSCGGEP
jgi:hypothetical protein